MYNVHYWQIKVAPRFIKFGEILISVALPAHRYQKARGKWFSLKTESRMLEF